MAATIIKLLSVYWKQGLALLASSVLRWILHITKTLAVDFEAKAVSKIVQWLLKGKTKMENTGNLGSVGTFELVVKEGKVSFTESFPGACVTNTTTVDGAALIDKLKEAIEKASPAGMKPIEDLVFETLKSVLKTL